MNYKSHAVVTSTLSYVQKEVIKPTVMTSEINAATTVTAVSASAVPFITVKLQEAQL